MSLPIQGVTQACFGLSYLLAFALEVAGLRWPRAGLRTAGLVLGAAGLLAHTLYLALKQPSPALPYGSLLLLAWVLAVFYFFGAVHHARQAWAVFVLPVILGLVGLSIVLVNQSGAVTVPSWLQGERLWGAIHGFLLLFAAVGISVSFLASVMYLVQSRRLRQKRPPLTGLHLLNLERLDAMNRRAVTTALPLLTAGLLLGGVLLKRDHSQTENWWSLKVLGTFGLWLVAVLLVLMRYAVHVPARRLALLSVLAFGVLIVSLVASHPFAESP